jgi:cellulose synthase/poly-beta-1,6-N-acetylglucosamine synthase-like glycosyltransferase
MLTPPSVSILRPLKGLDINLRENLLSAFTQNYPSYEIIFSVAKEDDPAVHVVKELMNGHPEVDTRLIIGKIASYCFRVVQQVYGFTDKFEFQVMCLLELIQRLIIS